MNTKSVQQVFSPAAPHMVGDGFRVHNFFPGGHRIGIHRMSPFFLMDYGSKTVFPPSDTPRGVGAHPHRGFETVTIAYHGRVSHHDSAGNSGIIGEGDVQWMTAGAGVLHKEYHEKEFSRAGGLMQMVQLWVNLPARHKMTAPKYQELTHAGMGVHVLSGEVLSGEVPPEGAGKVEVIAGEYRGAKGPAHTFTPIQMYNARLKRGATADFSFPETHNTGMLVIEGGITINGTAKAPADHFVLFANEGETVSVRADEDAVVLILSGEPIEEPIASYGPFVMNTQQEIMQAIEDFNGGKFGVLED
ncbi:MAG TPA: pirin family protein [Fibrobacteria bacterium]|nr:pirin family protein [Fibrobacteria bacterium]